jgi:serine/threonine protein phosphatase 1
MEEKKIKSRTLCVGDLHGNYKGLKQVLKRCNFDYKNDILISLGDIVDGHSESFEVVEELLKIKNKICIRGNHDDWWLYWIQKGTHPALWMQGSQATAESYLKQVDSENYHLYDYSTGIARPQITSNHLPDSHINFFNSQIPYYVDNQNRLFVHGGFNRHFSIEDPIYNNEDVLMWDRDLWSQALSYSQMSAVESIEHPKFKMADNFSEVFIGHTSTQFWKEDKPMNAANIWNLDTGGGWYGYISIIDIDTKEVWQSDSGKELYPEFKGR